MALLVSLVFLLLLTMIGLSSLQNATLQEKMAASLIQQNRAFQVSEAALREGERAIRHPDFHLPPCVGPTACAPPAESTVIDATGRHGASAVLWIEIGDGFYGLQNLGISEDAVNVPSNTSAVLYRVTAVGLAGQARSVLESIYATY